MNFVEESQKIENFVKRPQKMLILSKDRGKKYQFRQITEEEMQILKKYCKKNPRITSKDREKNACSTTGPRKNAYSITGPRKKP